MRKILSICMSLLIILSIAALIYYSYNLREGMNDASLCILKHECTDCDLTKNVRDCSLSWVLQPGSPSYSHCTVWNNDISSTVVPGTHYRNAKLPCETTIAFQSQKLYNQNLQNKTDEVNTEQQNKPISEDLLISFIEKGTEQINDVLTSKEIYDKIKKMAEKYLNRNDKKDPDPFNDPKNSQKRFIDRYDNPDMNPYNNMNPNLKTVLEYPFLITKDNISEMPISYNYMKNRNEPSWTDSLTPFN